MLEILEYIVSVLINDPTLTSIVPASNIFTGDADITKQLQAETAPATIVLKLISEVQRTVPVGARDSQVQLDIWSRNSMIECVQAYEQIINLLQYQSSNQTSAYIFWNRLDGATDMESEDRRVWHRAATLRFWSQKP